MNDIRHPKMDSIGSSKKSLKRNSSTKENLLDQNEDPYGRREVTRPKLAKGYSVEVQRPKSENKKISLRRKY